MRVDQVQRVQVLRRHESNGNILHIAINMNGLHSKDLSGLLQDLVIVKGALLQSAVYACLTDS